MSNRGLAAFLIVLSLSMVIPLSQVSSATTTTLNTTTSTTSTTSSTSSLSTSIIPFSLYSATSSNAVAVQGRVELLAINVIGGSPPYTYNFLVSNTNTGNVIFSTIVSNALTTNAVAFTLPVDANDLGTVTFTANVVDAIGANVLGTNTITVNSVQPSTTTSTTSTTSTSTAASTSSTSIVSATTSTSTTSASSTSQSISSSVLSTLSTLNTTTTLTTITSTLTTSTSTTSTSTTSTIQIINKTLSYKNSKSSGTVVTNNRKARLFATNSTLKSVTINLTSDLQVNIAVFNQSQVPQYIPKPGFAFYQYVQINGSTAGGGSDSLDAYLHDASYNFSVPAAWLRQQGISNGNIRLFKYSPASRSWFELQTEPAGGNNTAYFYSALSSSLSAYVVGFVTSNTVSTTQVTGLNQNSGWTTYFFAAASNARSGVSACSFTTNFIQIASNEVCKTGGGSATRHANVTVVGYNTVLGGNIVAPTGASLYNTIIAGIAANVIYANNGVQAVTTSSSTNSLTYSVNTGNSVVFLFYALAGNVIKSVTLPTNGGCTLNQNVKQNSFAGVVTANCITQATGSFTTNFLALYNGGTNALEANSIAAIVFPPYNVVLLNSPANGNIITNGTQQVNGNVITVIGTNTLVPVPFGTNSFASFSVDTPANSANIILNPFSGSTTNAITVMGGAIITATYTVPSCIPIVSNTAINFGTLSAGTSMPTTNAENVIDSGGVTSNIFVNGGNWVSGSLSFLQTNTLWNGASVSTTPPVGNQLTNSIAMQDTLVISSTAGNSIFLGLNIPIGQATGTYSQTINVMLSC